jgi:hypothetical protein
LTDSAKIFEAPNELVAVEAEIYYLQSENKIRQYYKVSEKDIPKSLNDRDEPHYSDAENNAYLKILPDTRAFSTGIEDIGIHCRY